MASEEQNYTSNYQISNSQQNWSGYRKYSRITPQMKDKLIFLIVRNNMSIKQASQHLKINYSSAKFIFSQYRDKNLNFEQPIEDKLLYCSLIKLDEGQNDGIILKSTIGGKYQGQSNKLKTIYDIYHIQ